MTDYSQNGDKLPLWILAEKSQAKQGSTDTGAASETTELKPEASEPARPDPSTTQASEAYKISDQSKAPRRVVKRVALKRAPQKEEIPTLKVKPSPISQRIQEAISEPLRNEMLTTSAEHQHPKYSLQEEFQRKLINPLQRMRAVANTSSGMETHPEAVERSERHESKAHEALENLAHECGPVGFLDQLCEIRSRGDSHYKDRMFHSGTKRDITRIINDMIRESGETLWSLKKTQIPQLAARGGFNLPAHPKELLLEDLITNSKILENGGRVLVISDHPATAKYLALKAKDWPNVSHATSARTAKTMEALRDTETALSHPNGEIEVFVLSRKQLMEARKTPAFYSTNTALTVIHDISVAKLTHREKAPKPGALRQRATGSNERYRLKGPKREDLPWSRAKQFVDLRKVSKRCIKLEDVIEMTPPAEPEE